MDHLGFFQHAFLKELKMVFPVILLHKSLHAPLPSQCPKAHPKTAAKFCIGLFFHSWRHSTPYSYIMLSSDALAVQADAQALPKFSNRPCFLLLLCLHLLSSGSSHWRLHTSSRTRKIITDFSKCSSYLDVLFWHPFQCPSCTAQPLPQKGTLLCFLNHRKYLTSI